MTIQPEGRILIVPPKDGACPVCGDEHESTEPHNLNSLVYQHRFRKRNGRYPTWADAMAHCGERVRERWVRKLKRHGIEVPGTVGESENPNGGMDGRPGTDAGGGGRG